MKSRRPLLIALSAAVVLIAAAGLYWFQPWRLVTDHEVQDALPVASTPSTAASVAPSGGPSSAPAAPQPAAPDGPRVLAEGGFVSH